MSRPTKGKTPTQLQLDEGRSENHLAAGLARKAKPTLRDAYDNSDDWWRSTAEAGIAYLASTGEPFDAFDVTELGVPDPDHPNRWGAVFRAASTAGLIESVGYHESRRPSRSGGVCRVWKGKAA